MAKKSSVADTVDSVIRFLENNKTQAIDRLFPEGSNRYKAEWERRDTVNFWLHLDSASQSRLVEIAIEHYAD